MYILINKPTRETQISASLIDHIWSNDPAGTVQYIHWYNCYPIFTNFLKYKCDDSSLISIKFNDYSLENIEKLKLSMSKVDWCSLLGGFMDPDVFVYIFN